MKKIIGLAAITFAVAISGILLVNSFTEDSSMMHAEALPPSKCISQTNVDERNDFSFHVPVGIPTTHNLEDQYVDYGVVFLYYAKDKMCEEGAEDQTFDKGLIRYIEANEESNFTVQINGGEDRLKMLHNTTDYPDRVSLGKINGMPALFVEPGIRLTLFIDDETNEVVETHENWAPGEVTVIDEQNKKYYKITADMPIENLTKIMEDTLR